MTVFLSIVFLCGLCSTFYLESGSRRSQRTTESTTHLNKLVFVADLIQKKQFGFQKLIGFTVGLQA
jgi:hypothetical protein